MRLREKRSVGVMRRMEVILIFAVARVAVRVSAGDMVRAT